MTTRTLPKSKQQRALRLVAAWLGPQMGYDGPAPTGKDAAYTGIGPELVPDWDWTGRPNPTIILESSGAPEDWACHASCDLAGQFARAGIFAEPYNGCCLSLYPA